MLDFIVYIFLQNLKVQDETILCEQMDKNIQFFFTFFYSITSLARGTCSTTIAQ